MPDSFEALAPDTVTTAASFKVANGDVVRVRLRREAGRSSTSSR